MPEPEVVDMGSNGFPGSSSSSGSSGAFADNIKYLNLNLDDINNDDMDLSGFNFSTGFDFNDPTQPTGLADEDPYTSANHAHHTQAAGLAHGYAVNTTSNVGNARDMGMTASNSPFVMPPNFPANTAKNVSDMGMTAAHTPFIMPPNLPATMNSTNNNFAPATNFGSSSSTFPTNIGNQFSMGGTLESDNADYPTGTSQFVSSSPSTMDQSIREAKEYNEVLDLLPEVHAPTWNVHLISCIHADNH
jgi:hypothetical protein